MKKILVLLLLFVFLAIFFAFLLGKKQEQPSMPPKTLPTPTIFYPPTTLGPFINLEKEKQAQQNYAKTREEYLHERPWAIKLPIKKFNYFISYDSEEEQFLASIYIYLSGDVPSKEEQIIQAKQDVTQAIRELTGDKSYDNKIIFYKTEEP